MADEPAPVAIDRFEGEVPFATQPAEGIFTWGGDADDPPTLALRERADAPEGAKVLEGTYDISGYGGLSHDYAADQPAHDWSAHKGIRFWWYGQNTAPLPPGSGKKISFEIKDGGAHGEASELWTTSFTDDWEGWHQVEIPFADFTYRGDYQPVGGIDQVLGLDEMWGYALTLPPGGPGKFAIDGMELYGKADAALKASVVTDAAVHPVKQGGTHAASTSPSPRPVRSRWTSPSPSPTRPRAAAGLPAPTTRRSAARTPSPRAPRPAPRTGSPSPRRRSPEPPPRRRSRSN